MWLQMPSTTDASNMLLVSPAASHSLVVKSLLQQSFERIVTKWGQTSDFSL